jgi:uncharacterized repeat protein (TIGR03837 family)
MQPAQRQHVWDIFCQVIDNHGDLGVCWRLARQLQAAGQGVRLWVDDASALSWMAPDHASSGIEVLGWDHANPERLTQRTLGDVWIEAFGCHIPEAFVAHGVATRTTAPLWINLEYLSAEDWVPRMHGLPSPIMSGPAQGWTKRFVYPGFTPETGGLLRETDLLHKQSHFDRAAARQRRSPDLSAPAWLISLFCYEPAALTELLTSLADTPHQLLVTPGRPLAAVQAAVAHLSAAPVWLPLAHTDQGGFDELLWACDLNFVRGEDSLVRALWAGRAFVWHIYPQDDQAHHAKLEAFLDWLQAPQSLRQFHGVWNGLETGQLPALNPVTLAEWTATVQAARVRLLAQGDLLSHLLALAEHPMANEAQRGSNRADNAGP